MVIAICAIICGADGFSAIEKFGEVKEDGLDRFLELKNGIPFCNRLQVYLTSWALAKWRIDAACRAVAIFFFVFRRALFEHPDIGLSV